MSDSWLIYGANGYTGTLITLEARKRGLQPIISGRSPGPLTRLSGQTGFKHQVVRLDERERLRRHLEKVSVVLNCAGPFSETAQPMIEACLDTNTHYLDITGEIDVFEYSQSQHRAAQHSGIVLCPGVGFDVVPTDCLAATLKNAMEDGTHLTLGFDSRSGLSPGTAKTTAANLHTGGRVRVNGKIEVVPLAFHTRQIDYGNGEKLSMTIPWGDVSTAYHTTGIPNIETYIPASQKLITRLRRIDKIRGVLGWNWVQNVLRKKIDQRVTGPDQETRDKDITYVFGEIRNEAGDLRTARVRTANGYTLTVATAIEISQHLLKGTQASGAFTPARLMGAGFISKIAGSSSIEMT